MTDHELARTRLWERARFLLAEVLALIGLPAYLAKLRWITPTQRREFLALIRPLESAARVLLYTELYQLPRAERRKAPVRAPHDATPAERPDAPLPEDSSQWAATFPLPRPSDLPVERPPSPAWSRPELYDSRPIAKRIEAVWRVLSDPSAALARYAKRMGFDARIARAVRPPPEEFSLAARIMAIGKADFATAIAGYDTG